MCVGEKAIEKWLCRSVLARQKKKMLVAVALIPRICLYDHKEHQYFHSLAPALLNCDTEMFELIKNEHNETLYLCSYFQFIILVFENLLLAVNTRLVVMSVISKRVLSAVGIRKKKFR